MEAVLPGAPFEVPALTTVAMATPAPDAKVDGATGIHVQLGAFSVRASAENLRTRIYKELPWLSDAIQVVRRGTRFRLLLEPYKTQDDARRIADRIQSELGLRPVIVGR